MRDGAASSATRGPTVSIVIPVFNRADLTQQCLEALAAVTTGDFEVIIVDNASSDGTPALLARFGSALTVIRNAENLGFARACNAGGRRAVGDYVVFLNNDTLPRAGWLEALVAAAEADPAVGAVGARLLYPDGTIQHAGIGFTPDFEPFHPHQGAPADAPEVTVDRDCEAVTGACLLVPRQLFLELGGFDEGYRMYFEDVDLCLRVRAAGRRVRYAAASVVVHLERASSASFGAAFTLNRASRERFRTRWVTAPRTPGRGKMRVLFQARPNLFEQPGGDTVVVQSLMRALEARGVAVRFSTECEVPAGTDVVHTINFATPEVTQRFAQSAERRRVPLVVTTLYEDWPRFLRLSHATALYYRAVLGEGRAPAGGGVDRAELRATLAKVRAVSGASPAPNRVTASIASALLACGESERQRLVADYPMARDVRVVSFGADHHGTPEDVTAERFARTHGVRDFVLCVARLEPRKNQLMLLEALRDDPRPVVLVAGGFSYCPWYAALCRGFRRRGPTLVLERLSSTMLAAAFREAAVHCMPSWYELPGLVSLEAALHGTRVAASSWGTIADYVGDTIAYLEPDDPESIARAVAAGSALPSEAATARARRFTWERTATDTLAVYEEVAAAAQPQRRHAHAGESNGCVAGWAAVETSTPEDALAEAMRARARGNYPAVLVYAERAVQAGVEAAAVGDLRAVALTQLGRLDEAQREFDMLLASVEYRQRAALGLGVIALERGDLGTAHEWLVRATSNGAGADAWATLGLCLTRLARAEDAWQAFVMARNVEPGHRAALHGLITLAGQLERLGELERHLRDFLGRVGEDVDVRYALAGCLYAAGRLAESRVAVREVLALAPEHSLAAELAEVVGE